MASREGGTGGKGGRRESAASRYFTERFERADEKAAERAKESE
jgi:hypothetical protein